MNKVIRIGRELVQVSDEIYVEYHKMGRRIRYMEQDIKVGRIDVDDENEKVIFVPNKEDSIERMLDIGIDIADENELEDIVCDKEELEILHKALAELSYEDEKLIDSIYYKNLTTREIAKQENVSQPAIVKRHKKVIEKIKKSFL